MPIKIAGQVTIDAPREIVWQSLFDLDVVRSTAAHVPGVSVERLDQIDETHYEGTATIGVAAIKGRYDGKITILEQRPPEFIRAKGEGKGGGNWTSGEGQLTLAEQDGKTVMTYSAQGNLSGPLASLGQRLVDTVGRQFIDQGSKAFAEEIATRHRATLAPETVGEISAPMPITESSAQEAPSEVSPPPPGAEFAAPQSASGAPPSTAAPTFPTWTIGLVILAVLLIVAALYVSNVR